MELLPERNKDNLTQLINPLSYNLVLSSVLEGKTEAQIYVNELPNLKAAILWVKGKLFFLGNPENMVAEQVKQIIESTYFQYLLKNRANAFSLFFDEHWRPFVEKIFPDLEKKEYTRSYYLKNSRKKQDTAYHTDIQLKLIDDTLLTTNLLNLDLVKEEMCSERFSVDDFMKHSFGYVAINKEEIVSWCMSEYNTDSSCELGIATVEKYRGKGYATLVANAVIDYACEQGIQEIGWHCWKENIPSIKTALKLGFKHIRDYPIIYIKL